ncbi:hypothetical protein HPO96_24750 [Kribbella sandramycini]|uniref:UDP-glucuronosyltransferase n=1 Tax=Kribbella sandramycini TaxID=60450 RepID=A0A7Y4P202_9ACTN|nr:hypothetical protein [Kribbella sandramycini]MBB6571134.1 hypothetical protein [Kribbella sandramycini]NOL43458.1 hypothetical protein [Kribbella sandramycini]
MIEVLTSGVALGVHVPGLLLADRIREQGGQVSVSVLERLMPAKTLATTAQSKLAFHRDFRVAMAGQKIAGNASRAADPAAVAALFADWHARGVTRFVVLSGFWLTLLTEYVEQYGPVDVDICHVDSVSSPSFDKVGTPSIPVRRIWLGDADAGAVPWSIPVSRDEPVPWADRDRRLLVHGGGWGMGTYRDYADELLSAGFALDVVAYEQQDLTTDGVRYFMIDPEWHPWLDDGYPPFGLAGEPFEQRTGNHGSFDLCRQALATVSKPGGGTLLDSLWSATPLVLLEPFGAHEQRNADLWISLGYGISFEDWARKDFAIEVLQELHESLLKADVPDYSKALL